MRREGEDTDAEDSTGKCKREQTGCRIAIHEDQNSAPRDKRDYCNGGDQSADKYSDDERQYHFIDPELYEGSGQDQWREY